MPDIFVANKNKKKDKQNGEKSPIKQAHEKAKLFTTYSFMPENLRFQTQSPGETILLFLRSHWITNLPWIIATILLLITPLFLIPLFTDIQLFPFVIPQNYITFLTLLWYMATFSFALVEFLLWYFTISLVTTERIVDIDLKNLLLKDISETRISKIEDVTAQTGGFIRSLFDFGDVYIQTAGSAVNFEFLGVPHPQDVVRIINQIMGKDEE